MTNDNLKGILLVDKAVGMTSHDVVDHVRRAIGMRRVGHTGTLDPAATGLLLVCIGSATRLSEHLTGLDKVYEGNMRLGVVTDSYDMEGEIAEEHDVPDLALEKIQAACDTFTGEIEQVPPMVSAVKIGGERLYKKARKGETVERPARKVTVREFKVLDYNPPLVHFRVNCSSGTYVRALAHDVGRMLGCGAALNQLRRVAVGRHTVDDALPVGQIIDRETVQQHLLPLGEALDLPAVVVRPGARHNLATGGSLMPHDLREECPVRRGWVQIKSDDGELLALGQIKPDQVAFLIAPRRVFIEPKKR